jgi:hypothetical protein
MNRTRFDREAPSAGDVRIADDVAGAGTSARVDSGVEVAGEGVVWALTASGSMASEEASAVAKATCSHDAFLKERSPRPSAVVT